MNTKPIIRFFDSVVKASLKNVEPVDALAFSVLSIERTLRDELPLVSMVRVEAAWI
jgi:hypothetical protein